MRGWTINAASLIAPSTSGSRHRRLPHSIRKSRYRLLPATAPSEKQMPGAKAVQEQVRRRINLKFSNNALIKICFTSLATEFERRLVRV